MKAFLMRLFGATEQKRSEEEERFKENLKRLEDREKELDALGDQIEDMEKSSKKKSTTLTTSCIDFTTTINKNITPSDLPAAKVEEADDQEDERHSGEFAPSHG